MKKATEEAAQKSTEEQNKALAPSHPYSGEEVKKLPWETDFLKTFAMITDDGYFPHPNFTIENVIEHFRSLLHEERINEQKRISEIIDNTECPVDVENHYDNECCWDTGELKELLKSNFKKWEKV